MTTPNLATLGLDPTQPAHLRAMLENAYRAGRAEARRDRPSDLGPDAEPGMPWTEAAS